MTEENTSPFTEQITTETSAPKTDSPFAHPAHAENTPSAEKKTEKKKISVYVVLATLFITLILLTVFMIFVMAVGGPQNPVLQTFGIDPVFLKESLIKITNFSFGSITFVLFLLLVIGVFRGLMTKKEEVQKKKNSFLLSLVSFGIMFIAIVIWLGVFNFISTFVVNAAAPVVGISVMPSEKEILNLKAPVELTLSSADVQKAWEKKKKKVESFAWDLNNDGDYEFKTQETSFLQEFNQSGQVTIRLMVTLTDGTQDFYERTLALPNAVFDYSPKSGVAPLKVSFDAGRFNNAQNPLIEYAWDFDANGEWDELSQKSKTEYSFKKIGKYSVVLRTKTATGEIKRYEAPVEVLGGINAIEAFKAVISVSPALQGIAPATFRFSASDSVSPDGNIVEYKWNFGDGSLVQEGKTVDHTFKDVGTYEVLLSLKDEAGNSTETTEKITVKSPKASPQAVIQTQPEKLEGVAPFTVDFDASASTDPDKNIVDYVWNYAGTETRAQKFTHVFREAGNYKIQLTVIDADKNESKAETQISISSPELEAKLKAEPQSGPIPLTVNFDASASEPSKGKILSYEWDFGDGTTPQLAGAQKSHRYTRVGIYEVKVKIYSDNGKASEVSTKVYARIAPTQSCFTASRHEGIAPMTVSFDSNCSVGNIVSWKWEFGDGTIARERKPDHIFEKSGNYEVTLEIIDSQNNVSTFNDIIVVK